MKKGSLLKFFENYFNGSVTEEEQEIISRWEILNAETGRQDESGLLPCSDDAGIEMLEKIHRKINKKSKLQRLSKSLFVKAAASLFIVFSAYLLFYYSQHTAHYITVKVPRGQRINVKLPDGSDVWLNAGAVLKYPEHFDETRDVYLLDGEAFFDVAHDEKSPFTVHSGKYHAKVLGTAFNIRAYKNLNDLRVTVTRGRVEVGSETESYAVLTPDREIIVDKGEEKHVTRKINSGKVSGWKVREVNLYDVPFEELVATVQNTYDVKVTYPRKLMDGIITTVHFSSTDNLEEVLQIIKMIHGLNYTINGKEVILEKLSG